MTFQAPSGTEGDEETAEGPSWDYGELRSQVEEVLAAHQGRAYSASDEDLKQAKSDRSKLRKLKDFVEDQRKAFKAYCMAPYQAVAAQAKEIVALINSAIDEIDAQIAPVEAKRVAQRRREVRAYFDSQSGPLGDYAEKVFTSPAFYQKSWDNKSTIAKTYQDDIREVIATAAESIALIRTSGHAFQTVLLADYCDALSMDAVSARQAQLDAMSEGAVLGAVEQQAGAIGFKTLKISGTERQMRQLMDYIQVIGMEFEELEDGMPNDPHELETPNFDTFVAFDIETSGTFGAACGDSESVITEIGAVKVVNGEVVDRFSELANPGREIVPHIARLTGITDAMVADRPETAEVVRMFRDFVGDHILMGHNIRSCDIPKINDAAAAAGFAFQNPYFDTYRYARGLQEQQGWESVKLPYLSARFGIEMKDAHRAWCDAEANVGVYLALQRLGEA